MSEVLSFYISDRILMAKFHFSRFLTTFWEGTVFPPGLLYNLNVGSAWNNICKNIFFALPSALKISSVFMQLMLVTLCILKFRFRFFEEQDLLSHAFYSSFGQLCPPWPKSSDRCDLDNISSLIIVSNDSLKTCY